MNPIRTLLILMALASAFGLGMWTQREAKQVTSVDYQHQVQVSAALKQLVAHADEANKSGPPNWVNVAELLKPSVVTIKGRGSFSDTTSGTGVVFDRAGHIITNLHVVQDLDYLEVELSTGETVEAHLKGSDPATDIAILECRVEGYLPPVEFLPNSESALVGQPVLAMGNPYGMGMSINQGIISGVERTPQSLKAEDSVASYLQTDASINPGHSGGPLVDQKGRVLGITTMILTETGQNAGVGFALPARDVSFVARQLIDEGQVTRGWLGIRGKSLHTLSLKERSTYGTERARGTLITRIVPQSPASESSLRPGDIILALNGEPVPSEISFRALLARIRPGTLVELSIEREGEPLRVSIQVGTSNQGI